MKASTNIDFTVFFLDLLAYAWHWSKCIRLTDNVDFVSIVAGFSVGQEIHYQNAALSHRLVPGAARRLLLVSWEECTQSFARQCLITVKKSKSGQRSLLPTVVRHFLGVKLLQLHPALGQAELRSLVLSFIPSASVFSFLPLCCGVSFSRREKLPAVQCWKQVHYTTVFRETAPAEFTHWVRR